MDLYTTADLLESVLKKRDIGKYTYTVSSSEKRELNVENGDFKLLRTVFSQSASVRVFLGARMGAASGNDLSEEGLEKVCADAFAAAESASEDPCHDIAPCQGSDAFEQGVYEPDMDRFILRIKEFLDTVAKEYPLVRVMYASGSFDRWKWLSRNTNGTAFEAKAGQYSLSLQFCASDGKKTTGLDYTGFSTADLDTPFIDMGDMRWHLEKVRDSISPEPLQGKFEGTVILTPGCASEFIYMTLMNYIGEGVIVNGTSQWLDKVGEKVADEKLTVGLRPYDSRIVMGERATHSGFRAEDVTFIDKGVLKTHWLSLYGSNKTGRPVVKNTGSDLVVEAGSTPLEDIIASVDRGLIMGGFPAGSPASTANSRASPRTAS